MNTLKISSLVVATVATVLANTNSAAAFSFSVGGTAAGADGFKSSVAGAVTVDFNSGTAPTSGFVTYSGITNNIVKGSKSGQHATPFKDTTNFMTISKAGTGRIGSTGSVTMNFAKAIDYFGLYWGSIDRHNKINFYNGGKLVKSFGGGDISTTAKGSWTSNTDNLFVNFFSGPGQTFDRIDLVAQGIAFESDNHTYRVATPEPTMMGGIVLIGLGLSRVRRRAKQAV